MRFYDPRLDTEPGAHPDDERYQVETKNPMLLLTHYQRQAGSPVDWAEVVKWADYCDQHVASPIEIRVFEGGKGSR